MFACRPVGTVFRLVSVMVLERMPTLTTAAAEKAKPMPARRRPQEGRTVVAEDAVVGVMGPMCAAGRSRLDVVEWDEVRTHEAYDSSPTIHLRPAPG